MSDSPARGTWTSPMEEPLFLPQHPPTNSAALWGTIRNSGLGFPPPPVPRSLSPGESMPILPCHLSVSENSCCYHANIRTLRPKPTRGTLSSCQAHVIPSNPEMLAKLVLGVSLSYAQAADSEDVETRRPSWAGLKASHLLGRPLRVLVSKNILATVTRTPDAFIKVPVTSQGSNGD